MPAGCAIRSGVLQAGNPRQECPAVVLAMLDDDVPHGIAVGGDGGADHFTDASAVRAGSMMDFAPRLIVALYASSASSTQRAISFTPSPCSRIWSAIGSSGTSGVVRTSRILCC